MLKLAASVVVLAACAPVATSSSTPGPTTPGTTLADANAGSTGAVPAVGCADPAGVPWQEEPSNQPTRLLELEDGLTVDIVEYPVPDYDARLWSQWGQGAVMADGTFISAVGDHDGPDGNSFFFAFDADTNTLTRFSDVLSLVDHQSGDFGYGKVHAQMVVGACGEVYAHTYWGTRRGLEYNDGYRGDLLLRIDPGSIEVLGVTAEGRGTASMAGTSDGATLFLEMVEPESNASELVIYDVQARQQVAALADAHIGNRALAVGSDDRVYFSSGATRLSVYDPASGRVAEVDASIPGEVLRAATPPRADGSIVGVTRDPDEFFILHNDETIEPLGSAADYTASLAMSPDGGRVYYVPGAHGGSGELGTPVIELDVETGEQTTLVALFDAAAEMLDVRLGGSYNVVLDPQGRRLYVGLNAGEADETFGRVFLAIINLP
jgi:hypothetical protein